MLRKTVKRCTPLLCTVIWILTLASADAQDHPPLGKLVDVGGYRVHLYCIGSGSPAVVIVGAGYSFDWALVQPDVSKFTQVCAYDHSGIAWSDPGPTDLCSKGNTEIEINAGLATILWLGLLITRRLSVTHPVSTPTFQFKLLGRMSQ